MSGMYSEHRRVNPQIREVRQPAPGGAMLVEFANGDIDSGDLDALVVHATDYLERLLAWQDRHPQLPIVAVPDVPTVVKQASELKPGDRFYTVNGVRTVVDTCRPFGEVYVTTDRGLTAFDDDTEEVRVEVPACPGSEMFEDRERIADAIEREGAA